jgi:hypothetical protein
MRESCGGELVDMRDMLDEIEQELENYDEMMSNYESWNGKWVGKKRGR